MKQHNGTLNQTFIVHLFDINTSYNEKPPLSLLKYINRSECIKTFRTEERRNIKRCILRPCKKKRPET